MISICLALTSLAPVEPVSRVSTPIGNRVDAASFICIGAVDEIISVPRPDGTPEDSFWVIPKSLSFARVRVERVIKGDASAKVVYHEAWTTWTCDGTRATVGERSLFLLGPGLVSQMTERQQQDIGSYLPNAILLRNVYNGDGVIPIRGSGDHEYVLCYPCPESWADSHLPYHTRWQAVLDYVEALAPFAPESVALLAQREAGSSSFDLRVLPDGRRRLGIGSTTKEVVTCDRYEATKWKTLRSELCEAIADTSGTFGSGTDWNDRHLVIRDECGTLEFFQSHELDPRTVKAQVRSAWTRALEAWAVVRESLDCNSCFDDRDSDRKLIEQWTRR